ncbi:MAG: hypothetical protein AB1752_14595 [Candidatus Zixiibacteriota bacterium]
MKRMDWMARLALVSLAAVTISLAGGCGKSKKSTNPQPGPALVDEWPEEADGFYHLLLEFWNCGVFNCTWDSVDAADVAICGNMFSFEADTASGFTITSVEGVVSDTLYHVVLEGTITFEDSTVCGFTQIISSRETGFPPARDYYQLISTFQITGCGQTIPTKTRFTLTRLGDFDCDNPVRPEPQRKWLIPGR